MHILVVDDDKLIQAQWRAWMDGKDCILSLASDGEEGVKKAEELKPTVCILDLKMPKMDGLQALSRIREVSPETEVIIVTGHGDIQSAVSAMREGAYDFLQKPVSMVDAEATIQRAVERRCLLMENRYLRLELGKDVAYSALIGKTPPMIELDKKIEQAAGSSANVFIRGESGTGKELVARLIHYKSVRAKHPFVAVNIAALSETLLESEMFGHEKSSFTGASFQKKGRFELADKGTLLLDEISEIPLHQQVKFLRVLQENEIERVGGTAAIPVDLRIISTTNRDFEELIKDNKFRQDLYYRLNVFPINVPALRDKKGDIPLLAEHYLKISNRKENKTISSISPEAMKALMGFDWPGNVRELMHCIESAVIMEKGKVLSLETIIASKTPEAASETPALKKTVETVELPPQQQMAGNRATLEEMGKEHIKQVLDSVGGSKKKAAAILGISRTTLYEKIKQYGF